MRRTTQPRPVTLFKWSHISILLVGILIWELLARLSLISQIFFPAPSRILNDLGVLLANGELATNTQATLERLLLGVFFGGICGLILGLAMGWSKRIRFLVDPFIAALHPIPKIAILPLLMVVFGIGETSKVFVISVAAFFPMLINSMAGVKEINPIYFEVAKNYGATPWHVFNRVVLPGSLPMIMSGVRLAFNNALVLTIAVELVAAQMGLGAMIWLAWEIMRTVDLYASLFLIACIGIFSNLIIQYLTGMLTPWADVKDAG